MAKVAIGLIDMREHHGAHPRFGAVDVVPFTPVMGVTMDECVEIANKVGKAYGEMGIPVYLYEDAATSEGRRNLATVRKGQYEGFFAFPSLLSTSTCIRRMLKSLKPLLRKSAISAAVFTMSRPLA